MSDEKKPTVIDVRPALLEYERAASGDWMACERPGCHHDIATDHEDGSGRCVRAGCDCEAALVRVSTAITGKVSR